MKTINIAPTAEGYIACLRLIIEACENAEHVAWAKSELSKIQVEES